MKLFANFVTQSLLINMLSEKMNEHNIKEHVAKCISSNLRMPYSNMAGPSKKYFALEKNPQDPRKKYYSALKKNIANSMRISQPFIPNVHTKA